jgi:phosphoribosyl 1,2-cyclic phosphate phosphodiesterase
MRSSVYIEDAGLRFLIDCGTDFRTQAIRFGIQDVDFVLLTHAHADHVNGLDDLRAFNMVHKHAIRLYAPESTLDEIRKRYAYCFGPPQPGGGIPEFSLHVVDSEVEIGTLHVTAIPVYHGERLISGYRINDFAYLTDVSAIPESSYDLLEGIDVLVTSALRRRPHSTHMSLGEALDAAGRIGARQTWFIHMCHDLEHEATNAILPDNIQLAHDGLEIEI